MANRSPLVLNPAGYQEYLQAADTLKIDGSVSILGTSFSSAVPLTVTGNGQSDLGQDATVVNFTCTNLTVSSGNLDLSGTLDVAALDINSSTIVDGVVDEDDLVSDSNTKLATQQSIKAYVDAITKIVKFAADTGTGDTQAGSTDTITFAGTANEIVTSVSGDTITFSQPVDVTIGNNLTITNALQIGSSTQVSGILDEDDFASDSNTSLATQQSIKAATESYTDAQIAAIPTVTQITRGLMSTLDKTKLDGIETAATADQTGAEIKALYEAENNAFTDAQFTKLAGIETGATADQTAAEIRTLVDSATDSNVFTDADHTKLDGIETAATADQTGAEIKALYEVETNAFTDAQFVKLSNIETAATADQTGAEIKALYEAEANAYTDAKDTKLSGIETGATADQTDAEIRAAVEAATDSNVFTDADHTKLNGIATGAEVNVAHDLSYTASTRELAITNGTNATLPQVTTSDDGLMIAADKSKIDGIEAGATADQTAAEIRVLVEAATDSNVFTDFDHTKLNGIETGATQDQTDAEIRAAVEAATDSNVFTDADHTKLDGIATGAEVNVDTDLAWNASTRTVTSSTGNDAQLTHAVAGGNSGLLSGSDKSKLDGIATGAEVNVDTNLSYTASTRELASSTGTNVTLPLAVAAGDAGLLTGSDKTQLDNLSTNLAAKADLVGGKLSVSQVPDIAITEFLGTVSAASDLTSLSGQKGDWATVTNEGKVYVITANDGSTSSDWTALEYPASIANLGYTASTRTITNSSGTDAVLPEVVDSGDSGLMTGAQSAKLTGIEAGATADQTDAEIRAAVEAATDSNVFTDFDHAKLNGIETAATQDQTGAEIKALYEAEANAFTDAQFTKLAGIATGAEVNVDTDLSYTAGTRELASSTGTNVTLPEVTTSDAGLMSSSDKTKLDGIATGAEANVATDLAWDGATSVISSSTGTNATLTNAVSSGNAGLMTGGDKAKLDGIASGAQVNVAHNLSYTSGTRALDISNGTGVTLPEATTSEAGLISSSDKSKLDGIAAGAEVNVATDLSYTASTRELASSTGTNVTLPEATTSEPGLLSAADKTAIGTISTDFVSAASGGTFSGDVEIGTGIDLGTNGSISTTGDVYLSAGNFTRGQAHTGHLEGSYNNVGANDANSNPIYTIGSSYNPDSTTLSNMYGIGYTHTNASFIDFTDDGSGWGLYVASDGDARVWLGGSNGLIVGTGNVIAYSSDGRLKTNVKPIANAVDKVKQLRGVEYDWVDNITTEYDFHPTKMHEVGVIAQEVEAVLPECVNPAPFNGNYTKKCGVDHKFLTVDYGRLTSVLIEAVKEQQEQIDKLKQEIKLLKENN